MRRAVFGISGALLLLSLLIALFFSIKSFSARSKKQIVRPVGRYRIRVSPSTEGNAQIVLIDTITTDCWACRGSNQWLYMGSPLFPGGK